MACTKKTARCAGVHPCCHEHLKEMLEWADKFLRRYDIKYWLIFGTLLGAVRDGKMIPWDEDVDLGVKTDGAREILKHLNEIYDAGYTPKVSIMPDSKVCTISMYYSRTNSLHLSFDVANEVINEYLGICVCDIEQPGSYWSYADIDELGVIEFEGRMYPIPNRPEFGLKVYYGEDWQTPRVKKWIKDMILRDGGPDPQLLSKLKELPEYEVEIGNQRKGFMDHNPEGPNRI